MPCFQEQLHLIIQKSVIRIITIEREYGCGKARIAEQLAARLGWKLWEQLLTEEIARFAHCKQSEVKQREEGRDPLYSSTTVCLNRSRSEVMRAMQVCTPWRRSMPTVLSESLSGTQLTQLTKKGFFQLVH
jgi:hypothetical protein